MVTTTTPGYVDQGSPEHITNSLKSLKLPAPVSKTQAKPEADLFFNGHRVAKTPNAQAFITTILERIAALEEHDRKTGHPLARRRARRPVDQRIFESQVAALACDLAYIHLTEPGHRICVSRSKKDLSKRNRYDPQFITEKFVDVMDLFKRPGLRLCSMSLGRPAERNFDGVVISPSKQTTLAPGSGLVCLIQELALTPADFGTSDDEEVIILKRPKSHRLDKPPRIDYVDTPQTVEMREQMRRINQWLETADIDFEGLPHSKAVDPAQRRLKRSFVHGSFEQHGRMYGGFWINGIPSEDRQYCVLIDGSPVSELDYGQMSLRLLYAEVGVKPHFTDAYAIPGLEQHREGVKTVVNALMNTDKPPKIFPKGTGKLFPPFVTIDGVQVKANFETIHKMILDFHRPVAHVLSINLGQKLQFMDSQIMVQVLLRLIDQGITALPIHDAILVAEDKMEQGKKAMLDCFEEATGFPGVVTVK